MKTKLANDQNQRILDLINDKITAIEDQLRKGLSFPENGNIEEFERILGNELRRYRELRRDFLDSL